MTRTRKPVPVLPPVLTHAKRRELRQKLLLLYISTPVNPPVLTEVLKRMEFLGVPYKTATEWKLEDEWDRKREEFQKALYAQMVTRVGDRLAKTIMQMVDDIAPIRARLQDRLARETFTDASSDKLVTSYVKLLELQATLAEKATGLITPTPGPGVQHEGADGGTNGSEAQHVGTLTLEEAREAGLAIMRLRRAAATAAPGAPAAAPAAPGEHGPNGAADGAGKLPRG